MDLLIKNEIGIIIRGCRAPPEMDEVKQDEGDERDCMKNADETETGTEAETETELCVGGCNSTFTFINILPFDIITHYHHSLSPLIIR